jgi:hypothetical protein
MPRLGASSSCPFARAIRAGAAIVMTRFRTLPAVTGDSGRVPATLEPRIITGLSETR